MRAHEERTVGFNHAVSAAELIEAVSVGGGALYRGESGQTGEVVVENDLLTGGARAVDAAEPSEDDHWIARHDLARGYLHAHDAATAWTRVLAREGARRCKREQRYDGRDGRNERT